MRDHLMYEREPEGWGSPGRPDGPRLCMGCGKAAFYDTDDDGYHHVDDVLAGGLLGLGAAALAVGHAASRGRDNHRTLGTPQAALPR